MQGLLRVRGGRALRVVTLLVAVLLSHGVANAAETESVHMPVAPTLGQSCSDWSGRQALDRVLIWSNRARAFSATVTRAEKGARVWVCVDAPDARYVYTVGAQPRTRSSSTTEALERVSARFLAPNGGRAPDPGQAFGAATAAAAVASPMPSPPPDPPGVTPPASGARASAPAGAASPASDTVALATETLKRTLAAAEKSVVADLIGVLTGPAALSELQADRALRLASDNLQTARRSLAEFVRLTAAEASTRDKRAQVESTLAGLEVQLSAARQHLERARVRHFAVIVSDRETAITVTRRRLTHAVEAGKVVGVELGPASTEGQFTFNAFESVHMRMGFALGYTFLQSRDFSLGPNAAGAEVIRATATDFDTSLAPLLLLTHSWFAVDPDLELPELARCTRWGIGSPWCSFLGRLPTFAVGVPLNRNPLQHLFLGMHVQLATGIGLLGGAHVGRVRTLRHGFVAGAPAPLVKGGFRVEDAVEERMGADWFVALSLTEATFISALQGVVNGS